MVPVMNGFWVLLMMFSKFRSFSSIMLYHSNTRRVLWPDIFMAVPSGLQTTH